MEGTPFLILTLVLAIIFLVKALFIVQENRRLVVIKLGRVEKVLGPGLCFILPFVDIAISIDLDRHVPNWAELSAKELNERVLAMVRQNPEPKAYE